VSVRLTTQDSVTGKVALYDSTTDLAFGPIFDDEYVAEAFLEHLETIGERDPRVIPAVQLAELAREFMVEYTAA
jgi:hypothetical protein